MTNCTNFNCVTATFKPILIKVFGILKTFSQKGLKRGAGAEPMPINQNLFKLNQSISAIVFRVYPKSLFFNTVCLALVFIHEPLGNLGHFDADLVAVKGDVGVHVTHAGVTDVGADVERLFI